MIKRIMLTRLGKNIFQLSRMVGEADRATVFETMSKAKANGKSVQAYRDDPRNNPPPYHLDSNM